MKKVIVCGVLTVLCIVATVLLRGPMGNADLEYTEVEATVISSESPDAFLQPLLCDLVGFNRGNQRIRSLLQP